MAAPELIDPRLLKALAHPTRIHILDILGEGPNSPSRISRRLDNVSLNLVCHHVKVLRDLDCIELVEHSEHQPYQERMYRVTKRHFWRAEEWEQVEGKFRHPITMSILRLISEDLARSLAHGKFDEVTDNHLSRSPLLELDDEGWAKTVAVLARTLDELLQTHDESVQRAFRSEEPLRHVRVAIIQFLIPDPRTDEAKRGTTR